MSGWPDLVAAATLGTGRGRETGTPDAELGGAPGGAPAPPGHDAALALLDAAARAVPHRRSGAAGTVASGSAPAGRRPARSTVVGPAAGEEDQPLPPAAAVARLEGLLRGRGWGLLAEWLRAAERAGCRVPHHLLPALMGRALCDEVLPVLGVRGRWLAGHRAPWDEALAACAVDLPGLDDGPEAERLWASGSLFERRASLARERRRDPGRARRLLVGAWSKERAAGRSALLEVIADGLGPDDETLLEGALDDRGQEVRERAAALLARLPGSAFAERTRARCASLVRLEGSPEQRRLVITLPAGRDAGTLRDEAVGASWTWRSGVPWLMSAVASAPLAFWTDLAGTDAAGVLALGIEGLEERQARELGWAWEVAAQRQRDVGWAEALVRAGLASEQISWGTSYGLSEVLGRDRVRRLLEEGCTGRGPATGLKMLERRMVFLPPYDPDHAALALRWLGEQDHDRGWAGVVDAMCSTVADHLPVETLPQVLALRDRCPPGWSWRVEVDRVLATVTTRAAIVAELS